MTEAGLPGRRRHEDEIRPRAPGRIKLYGTVRTASASSRFTYNAARLSE